jgi:sugar lactone lactonase YvrE
LKVRNEHAQRGYEKYERVKDAASISMRAIFSGGDFFEGARWHEDAWWVSDIFGGKVLRISQDGQATTVAHVDHWPTGLGWLPNGDLLIVSLKDRRLLRRRSDGRLALHADLSSLTPFWLNDMVVDRRGRAYVGNMGVDLVGGGVPAPTTLCRVDPDGSAEVVATDLYYPNGMAVTQDGRTLIVGESLGNRMSAYTIAEDGRLTNRRVWAQFAPTPEPTALSMALLHQTAFAPDGCAIDQEDCLWIADAANDRLCHVAPGGEMIREIKAPAGFHVFCCALGGADGRSLLVCAAPSIDPIATRGRAALFVETVQVPAAEARPGDDLVSTLEAKNDEA